MFAQGFHTSEFDRTVDEITGDVECFQLVRNDNNDERTVYAISQRVHSIGRRVTEEKLFTVPEDEQAAVYFDARIFFRFADGEVLEGFLGGVASYYYQTVGTVDYYREIFEFIPTPMLEAKFLTTTSPVAFLVPIEEQYAGTLYPEQLALNYDFRQKCYGEDYE